MRKKIKIVLIIIASVVGVLLLAALGAGLYLAQRYVHPPSRQAFINGRVLTMDARNTIAEAVVIERDHILMVGSTAEVRKYIESGTAVMDLQGKTMMPGIIDAHSHFPGSGLSAVGVDFNSPPIGTVKTLEQGYALLREKISSTTEGQWIMAFGFDNTLIAEKRFPTRNELDEISKSHPIYVNHISGHLGVANSAALAVAGISRETPDPPGGRIYHDPDTGELTGLVTEAVALKMMAMATNFSLPQVWQMLETANGQYLSKGITTAQMGLLEENYRKSLVPLAQMNILPLRLVVLPAPQVASGILDGRIEAVDTPRLHWGGFKLVLDGSIQGYTAFLSQPYYQLPLEGNDRGYLSMDEQQFRDMVMRYHSAGRQIVVHICGDAAMDVFLDAFATAQKAHPSADPRAVALHSLTVSPDQLDRAYKLGMTPSFTSTHVYYWGDRHRNIFLGPERTEALVPAQTAIKKGLRFALNMDTPVVPMDPWLLAWIAVNRKTAQGKILGPAERIDALTALRAITIDAAWQGFLDKDRGSIEPGKYADMIILADDPLRDPANLRNMQVVMTMVGGVKVFER